MCKKDAIIRKNNLYLHFQVKKFYRVEGEGDLSN